MNKIVRKINRPRIGIGIYTVPDISRILRLPQTKIRYWIRELWNERLGSTIKTSYAWGEGRERATHFYTLIEFYTFSQLRELGVSAHKILRAHQIVSGQLRTPFPFASSTILTDGKRVFYSLEKAEMTHADETLQITIPKIIEGFCKKIEFNQSDLAQRYWPLGKSKDIVIDPHHQFGQPIISNTNILAETLFALHKGGESIPFIANLYDLAEKQVSDAIDFHRKAA